MAGIVFIKTKKLEEITEFYTSLGAKIWLEQPNINILKHENMLFGFHQQETVSKDVLLTFVFPNIELVAKKYEELQKVALAPPKVNETYNIYNFFAKDPEDRLIEFQVFLHDIDFNFSINW